MTTPTCPADPGRFLELVEDFYDGGFRSSRPAAAGGAPRAGGDAQAALEELAQCIRGCRRCPLHAARKRVVPGEGSSSPQLLLVGEGPGGEEDRTGRPFVGRAGQYLDKWLEAIGLDRQGDCFITNIVKCRPPGNRDPQPEESGACLPYLERQLALLRPRAICTLGRVSTRILTGRSEGIGALRGRTYLYKGIPLVPTYHPSAVLRSNDQRRTDPDRPDLRRAVWEDLRRVRSVLQND
jgi:uracil-DNA glycosylase family 4